MTEPVNPSEAGISSSSPSECWWSISSTAIMDMLYAVHHGRSPESVYVEAYNNSIRERPEDVN